MKITFLDTASLDLGDLDLDPLKRLGTYRGYKNSRQDQVVARAKGAEVLIVNKCLLQKKELSQLPSLKLICVAATGVNNVDLTLAHQRGVVVCNVPGYSTTTVAEHTLLFLLAFSHRLLEHHQSACSGEWSRSKHFTVLDYPFSDLAGKTLGIIGYGAIGQEVARLARAFRMRILIARRTPLSQLLRESDFVTLHCPLTRKTRHLIRAGNLKLMKPTAVLLNLARGPIVDERAIANALHKKQIAGYGFDVLAQEPPPKHHPLLQKNLRNKVLSTPHVAWASRESRQRLVNEMGQNILAFRRGKPRNQIT